MSSGTAAAQYSTEKLTVSRWATGVSQPLIEADPKRDRYQSRTSTRRCPRLFNHQTHHQGQVYVMLSQTEPLSSDLHRILNSYHVRATRLRAGPRMTTSALRGRANPNRTAQRNTAETQRNETPRSKGKTLAQTVTASTSAAMADHPTKSRISGMAEGLRIGVSRATRDRNSALNPPGGSIAAHASESSSPTYESIFNASRQSPQEAM